MRPPAWSGLALGSTEFEVNLYGSNSMPGVLLPRRAAA